METSFVSSKRMNRKEERQSFALACEMRLFEEQAFKCIICLFVFLFEIYWICHELTVEIKFY